MGGLLDGADVSAEAESLLERDADRYTWAAAAIGSQNAASYQLATGEPVMAIGGFNGSDPSPTLARFKQYVADGRTGSSAAVRGRAAGSAAPVAARVRRSAPGSRRRSPRSRWTA
jgi:hypothetical protein